MSNELYHHGVKGMRWGVRKSKGAGSSIKRKKNTKRSREKSIKKMTDQELRERINRLQLEKQYRQLTKPDMSEGKQFVKNILKTSATTVGVAETTRFIRKLLS